MSPQFRTTLLKMRTLPSKYRCERRRAIFQTMSFHYYYSTTSTLNQDQTWTDAWPTHHFPGKLHREWTYHGNVLYGENFKELLQNLSLT